MVKWVIEMNPQKDFGTKIWKEFCILYFVYYIGQSADVSFKSESGWDNDFKKQNMNLVTTGTLASPLNGHGGEIMKMRMMTKITNEKEPPKPYISNID